MTRFSTTVEVAASPERVWDAVVDWPAHARWAPLTRMRVLGDRPDGVGARFVARTGIGPLGFDDPMEVTVWQPPADGGPGHWEVVKQGRVVLGRAWFDVVPAGAGRSTARWDEDVDLAPVRVTRRMAPVLSPVLARMGALLFTLVLRRMAREVEGGAPDGPAAGPGRAG